MKESELELRFVRGVSRLGGRAYKFVSPGNAGVPDRLVILPGGRIIFAELKADTGRLSKMQRYQIAQLRQLGAVVQEVRGEAGVQSFLLLCQEYMREADIP